MARDLTAVLVTAAGAPFDETLAVVSRALQGGLTAVLLRMPGAPAHDVYDAARKLRALCRPRGCTVIVHDRIDAALAAGADGVHLGRRSLPPAAARRVAGADVLLGLSAHNLDECGQGEERGVDYILLGHVFASASHPDEPPLGLDRYREAVLCTRRPVVAIGGVRADNVADVARAGGRGAAAISAFYEAEDPAATARAFRAAFAS